MANGFGSLYIGSSGLRSSQNALNVTANNMSNVNTTGYVRQQVLFADRNYATISTTAAVSHMQSGLGVLIGDVVHTRDIFLDKSYRTESGRASFYEATAEAAYEVENYLGEMEGATFQSAMEDFWESFEELSKSPADSIYQNLMIQKAGLFVSRAQGVYQGLKDYQNNINVQISDDIDRINELGKSILEYNNAIQKIEAGGVETAMTYRDARDLALDELAGLVSITYSEQSDGTVKVSIEGVEFVDDCNIYEMGKKTDKVTGFITPYWPHLSDTKKDDYDYVFSFGNDISAANKNDIGALKALVLARGDHVANYTDIEGMEASEYNDTTGMSVMLTAQAEFDQLMHHIITGLNDLLCPNIKASEMEGWAGNSITATDADGNAYTIGADTLILDAENCSVGADGELPPQELFTRVGTERYTKVTDGDGNVYYLYNEEDPDDTSKQYTIQSVSVNALLSDESRLPYLTQNGTVDWALAQSLTSVWSEDTMTLNPNDKNPCSFKTYYQMMVNELGTTGNVFGSTAESLAASADAIDNNRQQVIGVSADEELLHMIKYQSAYNASSRFINVVNEMIEHLLTSLA